MAKSPNGKIVKSLYLKIAYVWTRHGQMIKTCLGLVDFLLRSKDYINLAGVGCISIGDPQKESLVCEWGLYEIWVILCQTLTWFLDIHPQRQSGWTRRCPQCRGRWFGSTLGASSASLHCPSVGSILQNVFGVTKWSHELYLTMHGFRHVLS